MRLSTLPSADFSDAKARLTDVFSSAVRDRLPQLINRHSGKEWAVLLAPDLLQIALSDYRFEASVHVDAETREVVFRLPRFGIVGAGPDFEAARAEAVAELRHYAAEFFRDWSFYARTDRAAHLPWLLRFALTPDEQQADLLTEAPGTTAPTPAERTSASAAA